MCWWQDEVHSHSKLHGTLLQKGCLQVRARQQAKSAQVLESFKDGRVRLFVSRETIAASPRAVSSWDRGTLQTVGPAELGAQCYLVLSRLLQITCWPQQPCSTNTSGSKDKVKMFMSLLPNAEIDMEWKQLETYEGGGVLPNCVLQPELLTPDNLE